MARGRDVYSLDRPGVYEPRLFADRWIHLTPEGIGYVAGDLAAEIVAIRDASPGGEPRGR